MNRIRIFIVDDHQIVRQGIRSLLSNYPEFEIAGEAETGAAALAQIERLAPDVTLLDIRLPGESGLEILQQIRRLAPGAKVLMLTSFDEDEYVMEALRAGAQGFVLKSVSDEVLVNAIHTAYQGGRALSPQVADRVVQWALAEQPRVLPEKLDLEEEESHLLRLLAGGASNTDIAAQLFISNATVKRKLRKIFTKLNVETRAQAAAEAARRGLV